MKENRKLVLGALFASVQVIAILIQLPNGFGGNINAGDAVIFASCYFLGQLGIASSAIGALIADLVTGYAIYAPASMVIKAIMAIIYLIAFKKIKISDKIQLSLTALICEFVMCIGYFLYEFALFGFSRAAISVPTNIVQGAFAIVLVNVFSNVSIHTPKK